MIIDYDILIGFKYKSPSYIIEIKDDGIGIEDLVGTTAQILTLEKSKVCGIEIISRDIIKFGCISFNGNANLVDEILNYYKIERRNIIINDII